LLGIFNSLPAEVCHSSQVSKDLALWKGLFSTNTLKVCRFVECLMKLQSNIYVQTMVSPPFADWFYTKCTNSRLYLRKTRKIQTNRSIQCLPSSAMYFTPTREQDSMYSFTWRLMLSERMTRM
jgi:hypothetical protein